MAPVLFKGCCVCGCGFICQFSVLGCEMSRNGIRSLIIALAIGVVFWAGLAIEVMYVAGVFNG